MTTMTKPLVLAEARESMRETIAQIHAAAAELDQAIADLKARRERLVSAVKKLHDQLDR
jgi:hypothetical protein